MRKIWYLFTTIVLISACSGSTGLKYESQNDQQPPVPGEVVYPHPAGWEKPSGHGKYVIDKGYTGCQNICHGVNFEGGTAESCRNCHKYVPHGSGSAEPDIHGLWMHDIGIEKCKKCHDLDIDSGEKKACRSCHKLFPHEDNWKSYDKHGIFVIKNGYEKCATKCHGSDRLGGLSRIACDKCHALDIHPQDMKEFGVHGPMARGDKKDRCKKCHGEDLLGGVAGVSCRNEACHKTDIFPHQADWGLKGVHGSYVGSNGDVSCQTTCHGEDLRGGVTGKACDSCHNYISHTDEFKSSKLHGQIAMNFGNGFCLDCHATGDHKCDKACHEYPHASGWKKFDTHGIFVVRNGRDGCKKICHGTDLLGGDTKISCYQVECHTTELHPANMEDPAVHGPLAVGDKKNDCKKCHGEDYLGGLAGLSCSSSNCHDENYPHPDNWMERKKIGEVEKIVHGTVVEANGDSSCVEVCHGPDSIRSCASCHESYKPHTESFKTTKEHGASVIGFGSGSCVTCHTNAAGCASKVGCHPKYPHAGDFVVGHRAVLSPEGPASASRSDCEPCHGADATAGIPACNSVGCHIDYPHTDSLWANMDGGSGQNLHGVTFRDKMKTDLTTDCTGCHGVSYDHYSSIGKACKSCHGENFGHLAGVDPAVWESARHGTFFKDAGFNSNSQDMDICWKCHDEPVPFSSSDTRTSLENNSGCYLCHPAYPHIEYNGERWNKFFNWTCLQEAPVDLVGAGHKSYFRSWPRSIWGDGQFPVGDACGKDGACHTDGASGIPHEHVDDGADCGDCHENRSGCQAACHQLSEGGSYIPPTAPDCTPPSGQTAEGNPSAALVTPVNGYDKAETSLSVKISFSEAMKRETITAAGSFYLRNDLTGALVQPNGTVSCSNDWCKTLSANFTGLEYGTTYSIGLVASVTDWSGAPVDLPLLVFTTRSAPHPFMVDFSRTVPHANEHVSRNSWAHIYFDDGAGINYRVVIDKWTPPSILIRSVSDHSVFFSYTTEGENCTETAPQQECEGLKFILAPPPGEYEIVVPNLGDKDGNMLLAICSDYPDEQEYYGYPPCDTAASWTFTID